MKITIYELLGLMLKRQAPKKILANDEVYYLLEDEKHYVYSRSKDIKDWNLDEKIKISQNLDLEVIILDENHLENEPLEEKKIPEKIKIEHDGLRSNCYIINENGTKCYLTRHSKMIAETLNQVIDYLNSKEKGE